MRCSRCKKRLAVIFVSREVNGKPITEGLCFTCAKELKIPKIDEIANKSVMGDLENMGNQLMGMFEGDGFKPVGSNFMGPPFMPDFNNGFDGREKMEKNSTGLNAREMLKKDKTRYRFIENFGLNLTEKARLNKLDNIVGRNEEIHRVIQILSRRTKNNPCLIGEPGVGKTAIAEGIAQRIAKKDVPYRLLNKEVYLIDMTALIAGTQFRGQFESRVKGLISEIKKAGNIIPFIDEIHTLIGTGDSEGSMSAANILKPALSRGEIQLIGATTFNEYRKYIENDAALERRFQPVSVEEPNIESSIKILKGIKSYYENFHRVKVTDNIIEDSVRYSEKYINDRFLPDKAIDLLDEACVCRALRCEEISEFEKLTDEKEKLKRKELSLEEEISKSEDVDYETVVKGKYEEIAKIKEKLSKTDDRLKELEEKLSSVYVESGDLSKVVQLWTGIPEEKIRQSEVEKLNQLEKNLKSKIIGQDEAIKVLANAVKCHRVGIFSNERPVSFIFVGPTGVGKTELVKVLSEVLFDGSNNLIRVDMSEFMEKHAVSRLTGSPPGYVGYDDAGQLTEKVRRKPYSVVLFDEIEKAHPDVMNLLLQILDEGKVTDSHGRFVNFKNTIIVMTSNAGSGDKTGVVGFNKTQNELEVQKARKALEKFLRPEFIARVGEIVVFNKLTTEDLKQIAKLILDEFKQALYDRKRINFMYDEKLVDCLVAPLENGKYGARDLRKEIHDKVEKSIVELILSPNTLETVNVSANEGNVIIS